MMKSLSAYNRGRDDYINRWTETNGRRHLSLTNPYPINSAEALDWTQGVEFERREFDGFRREHK